MKMKSIIKDGWTKFILTELLMWGVVWMIGVTSAVIGLGWGVL